MGYRAVLYAPTRCLWAASSLTYGQRSPRCLGAASSQPLGGYVLKYGYVFSEGNVVSVTSTWEGGKGEGSWREEGRTLHRHSSTCALHQLDSDTSLSSYWLAMLKDRLSILPRALPCPRLAIPPCLEECHALSVETSVSANREGGQLHAYISVARLLVPEFANIVERTAAELTLSKHTGILVVLPCTASRFPFRAAEA
eukprot:3682116-Rhodomonas_salina.1